MNPQVEEKVVAACGTCGGQFRVSLKHAGKTIRCPKCANPMVIPQPGMMPPPPGMMAPPPQGMAAPPPMAGSQQPSSRRVALSGGLTHKIAKQSGRKRPTQSRRGGREDRYGYQPKPGMSPTTLWSIIGGSAAVVLLIIIVAMSGGSENVPNNSGTGPDSGTAGTGPDENNSPRTPQDQLAEGMQHLNDMLSTASTGEVRFRLLGNFRLTLDQYPEEVRGTIRDFWEGKVVEVADAEREDIFERAAAMEGEDDDETEEMQVEMKVQGLVWLSRQLVDRFDDVELARPYLEELLELTDRVGLTQAMRDSQERARSMLGWRQIEIRYPAGSDLEQAFIDGLLNELEEWDGRWVSPEEYEEFQEIRAQVEADALRIRDLWAEDPFLAEVHRVRMNLKFNHWFRNIEFGVHDVRPYALLLGRHDSMSDEDYEQALDDRQQTLTNYWEAIRERYVEGWELSSQKPGDTLETPQPFIFINFANRDQLNLFYREANGEDLPEFARAYYSRLTEFVYYYDSDNYDPNDFNVVMHEATHQFFDRYSAQGIEGEYVRTHLFNEGMAEYTAGYQGDGRDPQFPGLNGMRIPGIVNFQQNFTNKATPWGEDWCMWPVAYIWQPSNIPSLLYTGLYMVNNIYSRAGYNPGWLRANWEGVWHSFFYSYGWAFCYYMMEVSDYRDEFSEYCRVEVTNPDDGGAEAFCRAMGWDDVADELAEHPLHNLMLRTRGDVDWDNVTREIVARVEIMNRCEGVQRLQNEWFTWMLNGMHEEAREQGIQLNR